MIPFYYWLEPLWVELVVVSFILIAAYFTTRTTRKP